MGELFNIICELSTLESAWKHVHKKGAKGGLDGIQPSDMEMNIEKTLTKLREDLLAQKYIPVPYAKGAIPKFNKENEWRNLSLPSVVDKIVQQSFLDTVGPIFERDFLDCSYAYQKGKGAVKAIKRVEHILRSYPIKWVVTMDIDNFFETMNHGLLIDKISHKVDEPEILNLVSLWLNAGIISPRGEYDSQDEGIAQGSLVSPLFSNTYLHSLDRFAVDNKYRYVRYSDNFIILSENKDSIYAQYEQIRSFLEDRLKLRFNENPYPFKDINKGFVFLGIFFKDNLRRISKEKETKVFRKLNWLTDKLHQKDPETFLNRLNESVEGKLRYYAFINPVEQFESFDKHLIKRLKFLLLHFLEKGFFTSRDELYSFVSKVKWFTYQSKDKSDKVCRELVNDIYRIVNPKEDEAEDKDKVEDREKVEPVKKSQPIQAKRQTAQKNRYLKQLADQTEVIISTPGISIGKTGRRIILREQRKNILDIPFSKIRNVSVSSQGVSLSSDVIFHCSYNKIPITFYTYKGMPYAMLQTPLHSMGAISVLQIKTYETEKALEFVKKILTGKSKNQMNLLKFYLRARKNSDSDFVKKTDQNIEKMQTILKDLQGIKAGSVYSIIRDRLFSMEARISVLYWECMKLHVPPELGFEKRQRFQASDVVNNMLNYGYGILYQRVWHAVLKAGLNPHISFLHAFQANKPTLVYDLVEEFRQPFIDRSIFSLLTRGKKGSDLKLDKKTGMLTKETKDQVIKSVINRLASLTSFRGKKVKCEDIIEIQVRNLVSFLEGKESYKPYITGY